MSHRPGMIVLPRASIVRTPCGIATLARGPTPVIRPSPTMIEPSTIGARIVDDAGADEGERACRHRGNRCRGRELCTSGIDSNRVEQRRMRRGEIFAHALERQQIRACDDRDEP